MASVLAEEKSIGVRGKGLFVAYDVPCYKVEDGRGHQPSRFHYMLRKILETGKVHQVQRSLLLVEDPALLNAVVDLVTRYGGSVLVLEGTYTFLPER